MKIKLTSTRVNLIMLLKRIEKLECYDEINYELNQKVEEINNKLEEVEGLIEEIEAMEEL